MGDTVILDIKGIQCDSDACDYVDMEIDFEPDKFLNAPCPKCGCNLFTQADYDLVQTQFKLVNALNEIFPAEDNADSAPYLATELKLNGTGKVEIGEIRLMEKE